MMVGIENQAFKMSVQPYNYPHCFLPHGGVRNPSSHQTDLHLSDVHAFQMGTHHEKSLTWSGEAAPNPYSEWAQRAWVLESERKWFSQPYHLQLGCPGQWMTMTMTMTRMIANIYWIPVSACLYNKHVVCIISFILHCDSISSVISPLDAKAQRS